MNNYVSYGIERQMILALENNFGFVITVTRSEVQG